MKWHRFFLFGIRDSLLAPAIAVALWAQTGRADAASIGVNFGTGNSTLAPTASAGVAPFAQTHWTNLSVLTATSLQDDTGAATTANLAISGAQFSFTSGVTLNGPDDVLNDNVALNAQDWSFTITNIP
jgi:hypothetical protein